MREGEKGTNLANRMLGLKAKDVTRISCINPAGTITQEAITKIRFALSSEKNFILQVVEEDLLTLPVCFFAPTNSLVCYGQPLKG